MIDTPAQGGLFRRIPVQYPAHQFRSVSSIDETYLCREVGNIGPRTVRTPASRHWPLDSNLSIHHHVFLELTQAVKLERASLARVKIS